MWQALRASRAKAWPAAISSSCAFAHKAVAARAAASSLQVRTRLAAGGRWIRTIGTASESCLEFGKSVEPINVDYMMRRNGNNWLISDIYLDGAISEVATHRSEFAAILKSQGIDGLIAALNRKADILTGTTARSF
jgi:MlaC protein